MKYFFGEKAYLTVLMLPVLAISGCGQHAGKSDTLKVGVRDDIINFSYLNETTGKYYGLEIDIANEMARRLGYKDVEFQTVMPDNRKDTLLNGEVDCLIATYSITDTRTVNFDFSAPYYTDDMILMVEKSTLFDSVEDLKGKNVGVMSGANSGPLLAIKMEELGLIKNKPISETDELVTFDNMYLTRADSYDDLSVLLEEGKVDAACLDACIAGTYMDDDREFLDISISKQEYGVATQKDSKLSQPVADTIQEMLDDGTIEKMIDKWD